MRNDASLYHERPTGEACAKQGKELQSAIGNSHGKKGFDGSERTSDYLAMKDGTRLAYDLVLPTERGKPASDSLPVLFKYTPYGRAWTIFGKDGRSNLRDLEALPWYAEGFLRLRSWLVSEGSVLGPLWRTKWLGRLVKSGYAAVVVERPGTGASFGRYSPTDESMARESDEILNWIASQRWCDGSIGMFGDSVQAQVQLAAASTANRHLKAVFAESTWLDIYQSFMYPGGIYAKSFGAFYKWSQKLLDSDLVTPVDRDEDGTLLAEARAERQGGPAGQAAVGIMEKFVYRDSPMADGRRFWELISLYPMLESINRSGIPVFLTNGWFDPLARENFFIYSNLTVPKRLIVRPTDHGQEDAPGHDVDYAAEAHRWFDHWLKGIDNGIMNEPPIRYFLMGEDRPNAWRSSEVWPTKDQSVTRYYLAAGPPGTESTNNGSLVPAMPNAGESDSYAVDYRTTTGKKTRWTAINWVHDYPNMRSNDAKALTYTTPSLKVDTRVVGHPVLHLWFASDASDLDFFALLEEVDRHGNSIYVTEGNLRASHRMVALAPYDTLGLPYHNHYHSEVVPIPPGTPVELDFDLLPTAYRFSRGNRIRLALDCCDADNFDTPILEPPPNLRILRGGPNSSCIDLPLLDSRGAEIE
jgi:hypothetical protein